MPSANLHRRRVRLLTALAGALVHASWVSAAVAEPIPIAGRVIDATGAPVAGAEVELAPLTSRFERQLLLAGAFAGPPAVSKASTRADGRFRVTAPSSGVWRVAVSAAGFAPIELVLAPLLASSVLPPAILQPDHGMVVIARAPDGAAIANARVIARTVPRPSSPVLPSASQIEWVSSDGSSSSIGAGPYSAAGTPQAATELAWWRSPASGLTGADGRCRLPAGEGETLTIEVAAEGRIPRWGRGEAGQTEVELTPAPVRRLIVRGPRGEPVAAAVVSLDGQAVLGVTGADGRLAAALPDAGLLGAEAAGGLRGELRLGGDGDRAPPAGLAVRLEPAARIHGRVLERDSREPVADALVWPSGDPGLAVRSGLDGAYEVASYPSGVGDQSAVDCSALDHLTETSRPWFDASGDVRADCLLLAAARLRGVVVDEAGAVVAGAAVTANPVAGTVASRGDGGFELWLPAREAAVLSARKPGYAPQRLELGPPGPAGHPPVRITLSRGRTAVGLVVDAAGAAVARAEVEMLPGGPEHLRMMRLAYRNMQRDAGGPPEFGATTDEGGRFAIPSMPSGTFDLEVRSADHAPASVRGIELPGGSGEVDLGVIALRDGAAIEGTVVDADDRPLEGARVRWSSTSPGSNLPSPGLEAFVTGPDGQFRFAALPIGEPIEVSAELDELLPASLGGIELPTDEPLTLRLLAPASVRGVVVDDGGRPLAGAAVFAERRTSNSSMSGGVTTDERGAFSHDDMEPGEVWLIAMARGFLPLERHLELEPGQRVEGLRLELEAGAYLEGTVYDALGNPVTDAWLTLEDPGPSGAGSVSLTEPDGRYRLDGLAPGSHVVAAHADDHPDKTVEVEVAEGANHLDIHLEAGVPVSGRVVDGAGVGREGAHVVLSPAEAVAARQDQTGRGGFFTVANVPDGTYNVTAITERGARSDPLPLEVSGVPIEGLELILLRGGRLRGRVSGAPPEDLLAVRLTATGPGAPAETGLGTDGGFVLDDLAEGDWEVTALEPGSGRTAHGEVAIPAEGEAQIELILEEGLTLTGVVLLDGSPLPGARVSASSADASASPSPGGRWTDPRGRFRIPGLSPGAYVLEVLADASGLRHERPVDLGEDLDILVEIATARLTGRVVDAITGTPVEGAEVAATTGMVAGTAADVRGWTDQTGAFVLRVPAGEIRLWAVARGYAPAEQKIELGAGETVRVDIALAP